MLRALLLLVAVSLACAQSARADGPRLKASKTDRLSALACKGDLAGSPQVPVLLIHGTGATPEENWSWGYERDLLARGHAVCTVALVDRGYVDVQRSVEYVVTAIRQMAARSGRKISLVGHSQGAFMGPYALRVWPDLAAHIEDFIGISGAYDRGSEALKDGCAEGCVASLRQLIPGSKLLTQLARRSLPAGPSYSALGTLADTTVTPQPQANEIEGARSIEIQDVCPGRRFGNDLDHVYMAADAVMHALVLDALTHPGTAEPARVDASVCNEQFFSGADPAGLALALPGLLTAKGTDTKLEPRLRCYLRPRCRVLSQVERTGRRLVVAATREGGRVRVRARGRIVARRFLPPGVPVAIRLPKHAHTVALATRPLGGLGYRVERRLSG